jgi:hypothetical protein
VLSEAEKIKAHIDAAEMRIRTDVVDFVKRTAAKL